MVDFSRGCTEILLRGAERKRRLFLVDSLLVNSLINANLCIT